MPDLGSNVVAFAPRPRRPRRKERPTIAAGAPLEALLDSWRLALDAAAKSKNTIEQYTRTARNFIRFLAEQGMPDDAERVAAEHVRAFLVHERERASVQTAAAGFRNLGAFFTWIIAEEDRTGRSPVLKADTPNVPKKAREYLSDEDLTALLTACKGGDVAARRDTAIIRCFIDNGVRVSGLSGMRVDDVNLKNKTIRIRLKGGDELLVPIGPKTATAIDRYLRIRASQPQASSPWLWLGLRGTSHLSPSGVRGMLNRRGEEAGVENVHPHRFRGTFAHRFLKAGGSERGAMAVAGWRTRTMLDHYAEELVEERARDEHARLNLGDRV